MLLHAVAVSALAMIAVQGVERATAPRSAFESTVVGRRVVMKARLVWFEHDTEFTRLTRHGKVRYGMWLQGHFVADPDPQRVLGQLARTATAGGTTAARMMPPGTHATVTGVRWLSDAVHIAIKDDSGNDTGFLVEWDRQWSDDLVEAPELTAALRGIWTPE